MYGQILSGQIGAMVASTLLANRSPETSIVYIVQLVNTGNSIGRAKDGRGGSLGVCDAGLLVNWNVKAIELMSAADLVMRTYVVRS
ncbi:hypothetical protein ElyMa_004335200 [Elysia marginata]|uniref:Uncharacterized protein n=1 Tax=Elysia marginata TaxID=1093978 RepID=A0AAV4H0N2_9GAST|nr:hypothetical protein ElyMa_004335200 [Elysia marginata]